MTCYPLSIAHIGYQSALNSTSITWKNRSDTLVGAVKIGSQKIATILLPTLQTILTNERGQHGRMMIRFTNREGTIIHVALETIQKQCGLSEEHLITPIFDQALVESLLKQYASADHCLNKFHQQDLTSHGCFERRSLELTFEEKQYYIKWTKSLFPYLTFKKILENNLLGFIIFTTPQKRAFLNKALSYYENDTITPLFFSSLYTFPDNQWTRFEQHTLVLLCKHFDEKRVFLFLLKAIETYSVLDPFTELSESHFHFLIEQIKDITTSHDNQEEIEILMTLIKLSSEESKNVLSHTARLGQVFDLKTNLYQIVDAITIIPEPKRISTIESLSLLKDKITAKCLSDILVRTGQFLNRSTLSDEEWRTLLKTFSKLVLTDVLCNVWLYDFDRYLRCFGRVKWTSLVPGSSTLIKEIELYCNKSGEKPKEIINFIADLPLNQSMYALKLANALLYSTEICIEQSTSNKICRSPHTNAPQTLLEFFSYNYFFDTTGKFNEESIKNEALQMILENRNLK